MANPRKAREKKERKKIREISTIGLRQLAHRCLAQSNLKLDIARFKARHLGLDLFQSYVRSHMSQNAPARCLTTLDSVHRNVNKFATGVLDI